MKKIIIYLGIALTTFTSCSDFIDEDVRSSVPADSNYKTAAGFQYLVNSTYARLKTVLRCSFIYLL